MKFLETSAKTSHNVEDSFITMTKEIITLNMEKTNTMTKKDDGRRIKIDQNNKAEKIEMGDK